MIYKGKFKLLGTGSQIALVVEALDRIYFPWDKLTFPQATMDIGWDDLNGGATLSKTRKHKSGTKGIIDGREWVLGVFYTHGEGIFIDNQLEKYPEIAQATVSAEIAHAVDYFLPLKDTQRTEIMTLLHGGDPTEHGHSWWEKIDYGEEYFTLVGEAFMQAFTIAYSDMSFDASDFAHSLKVEDVPKFRQIMGVERTDYVPPVIEKPAKKVIHKGRHIDKETGKERYYIMYSDFTFKFGKDE